MNVNLQSVSAVFVLDNEGERLLGKYYPLPPVDSKSPARPNPYATHAQQREFEKAVADKALRSSGDILIYKNHLVLYKPSVDLTFFVVAEDTENEIMLQTVLRAFTDAVAILLHNQVEKRALFENLDLILLCLDETIDDGIILEIEPAIIANRVSAAPGNDAALAINITGQEFLINNQPVSQVVSNLGSRFAQSFLQGAF